MDIDSSRVSYIKWKEGSCFVIPVKQTHINNSNDIVEERHLRAKQCITVGFEMSIKVTWAKKRAQRLWKSVRRLVVVSL